MVWAVVEMGGPLTVGVLTHHPVAPGRLRSVAGGLWVAELRVSEAVAAKINGVHKVTVDEVQQSLIATEGLVYVERPDDGVEVQVWIRGSEHLAVIFPRWGDDPDGVYYLATVYPRRSD